MVKKRLLVNVKKQSSKTEAKAKAKAKTKSSIANTQLVSQLVSQLVRPKSVQTALQSLIKRQKPKPVKERQTNCCNV